jgi:hypothetical protein
MTPSRSNLPLYVITGLNPGDLEFNQVYRLRLGGWSPSDSPAAAHLILVAEPEPLDNARGMISRLRGSGGDASDYQAAAIATTLLAVAEQLMSIDDALRNTIGSTPR